MYFWAYAANFVGYFIWGEIYIYFINHKINIPSYRVAIVIPKHLRLGSKTSNFKAPKGPFRCESSHRIVWIAVCPASHHWDPSCLQALKNKACSAEPAILLYSMFTVEPGDGNLTDRVGQARALLLSPYYRNPIMPESSSSQFRN